MLLGGKGPNVSEGKITKKDIERLKKMLSGGKILTKADVRLYCRSRYRHLLKVVRIERKLMMLEDDNLGRGVVVSIQFQQRLTKEEKELIRVELQNDLNAKSAFFTHIKVEIDHEE